MMLPDSAYLETNPAAGLASISSAKSCAVCVETRITTEPAAPVRTVELLGDVEATLVTEVEIDQRHVRSQLFETPKRISAR